MRLNYKHSPETRRKIGLANSIALKGKPSNSKGKKRSPEARQKMSDSHKGQIAWNKGVPMPDEQKIRLSIANMGRKRTLETALKIKKSVAERKERLGYHHSPEARKNMMGKGRHFSDDAKLKMSISHKKSKTQTGEFKKGAEHPNWLGGISFEPYTLDWTNTLKRSIRERDRYTCQICKSQQEDRTFSIHHINYNKKDNNPDNLITLCANCHMKTNYNRKYFMKLLQNKI